MKKSKFLVWALAGASLALGACSSDDVVEGVGNVGVAPGEVGYMSLNINLPQQPRAARAAVGFDDGLAAEYDVKDATLMLFAGTDEASATFYDAFDLNTILFDKVNNDQITSQATITQQITKPAATGNKLFALVVLNDNGLITISGTGTAKQVSFGETTLGKTETLQWFNDKIVNSTNDLKSQGFFMTNAPLANTAITTGKETPVVMTLAPIDETKVFRKAEEAGNQPAAKIYVERAVAKVTVESNPSALVPEKDPAVNPNLTAATIDGWFLDNTNSKTYVVRSMKNTEGNLDVKNWLTYSSQLNNPKYPVLQEDAYRFVGGTSVGTDVFNTPLYRTYFALDPNFNNFVKGDLQTIGTKTPAEANVKVLSVGRDNPGYCFENVFDVANQKEESTTRVIVAAKLTVKGAAADGSFYTLNGNTNTVYTLESVKKEVQRILVNWFEKNNIQPQGRGKYIQASQEGVPYTFGAENVTVNLTAPGNGGIINLATITVEVSLPTNASWADASSSPAALKQDMEAALHGNTELKIGYYKGGVAYYPVGIHHFGDEQTPWVDENGYGSIDSYPNADGNADKNWLGRYGVLRNNWYNINVSSIKNIGAPEVPEVTDKWNDPKESYMAVQINVLSWAVRKQQVEL